MKMISVLLLAVVMMTASCAKPAENNAAAPEGGLDPAAFQQAMTQLYTSTGRWFELTRADKIKAVETVFALFKDRENVAIIKTPEFYVDRTDAMLRSNPALGLNLPTVLKILAVMEYDFYNGQNKDQLARDTLGPQLYEQNRRRRELEGA
ncbi:MAG TPA: hypothetical protein PKL97_07630 [Candidatus Omnitrophota bacterium]|nr:hypothetical protein [Candidatus Omnitrophota bacterium]